MSSKAIQTEAAPAAVGPYSQGVEVGNLLFVSGQIPLDPQTGDLVSGDITIQTRRVLANIRAVVQAAGMDLDQIVRCELFLTEMADFAAVNEVYAEFFSGSTKPARQAVEVSRLPKDVNIEISAIACRH